MPGVVVVVVVVVVVYVVVVVVAVVVLLCCCCCCCVVVLLLMVVLVVLVLVLSHICHAIADVVGLTLTHCLDAVRGHRTDSNNSGVEHYLWRKKITDCNAHIN